MLIQPYAFGRSGRMLGIILRCQHITRDDTYPDAGDDRPKKRFHARPLNIVK
ncbi:MAG: hypothetical protein ACI9MJ_000437 [Alphaproteobacteria bacterium]|jgi:hypothetical protein